jgi:hypothetical protein
MEPGLEAVALYASANKTALVILAKCLLNNRALRPGQFANALKSTFNEAVAIAAAALTLSATVSIRGMSNDTGRSFRAGNMRSIQRRSAVVSPCFAKSMALRVNCSASPSSSCSAATVARLRAPLGRPPGFPLCPGLKVIRFVSSLFY